MESKDHIQVAASRWNRRLNEEKGQVLHFPDMILMYCLNEIVFCMWKESKNNNISDVLISI